MTTYICRPKHIPSGINTERINLLAITKKINSDFPSRTHTVPSSLLSTIKENISYFPRRTSTIPAILPSYLDQGRKKFGFLKGSRDYYKTEQHNLTTTAMCGSISRALSRCGVHNNMGSYVDRRQKLSSITEDPQVFEEIERIPQTDPTL